MNKREALKLVLLDLKYSDSKISLDNLLDVISKDSYNIRELGYKSYNGASKFVYRNFPNKPKDDRKLCNYLLSLYDLKYCQKCKLVKSYGEFTSNISKPDKLNSWCKVCKGEYQHNNLHMWREYQANYKSRKLLRTPIWANFEEIQKIYNNCPKGYHVDHIVPLQNNKVCGLHVENNLQYLTATENMTV